MALLTTGLVVLGRKYSKHQAEKKEGVYVLPIPIDTADIV